MSCRSYKTVACLLVPMLLAIGCSSSRYAMRQDRAPSYDVNINKIPDAVPRVEPRSKYGNPESYVVRNRRYQVMKTARGFRQRGMASWYGSKFHGHRTSSGETYNMYAMTAAHKSLPLPSYVRVTHLDNNKSVIVRINDRGPFHDKRIIDLSYAAAKKLGITANGTAKVEISYIDPRQARPRTRVAAINNKPAVKTGPAKRAVTATKSLQRLYLQVGAFAQRINAEQLRQRVAHVLESGEINTGYNVENKLYRVRIGPLASIEEADKLADKLTQSGIPQPRIVID